MSRSTDSPAFVGDAGVAGRDPTKGHGAHATKGGGLLGPAPRPGPARKKRSDAPKRTHETDIALCGRPRDGPDRLDPGRAAKRPRRRPRCRCWDFRRPGSPPHARADSVTRSLGDANPHTESNAVAGAVAGRG